MRNFIMFIFISMPLLTFAQDIQLSKDMEVENALKLNSSLSKVSKLIGSCMKSGQGHSECLCANVAVINEFNLVVNSTFIKYPHWLKARTLNFKLSDEMNGVINPKALYAEANKVHGCSKL